MRELKDSDIFSTVINKGNGIYAKINAILGKVEPSVMILNEILSDEIKKKIVDKRRDQVSADMLTAVMQGRMVLFLVAPDKNITNALPFFIYKQQGIRKVAVNLTSYVVKDKLPDGSIDYNMGQYVNIIYSILHSAYLALDKFEPNTVLSPDALYYSAVLWAEMFNKPIFDVIGLQNIDRKKAFMYFAIRFFLGYFMECPETQIDSLSMKYIGKKNDLILYMDDYIANREVNLYEGIIPFCQLLFNSEFNCVVGINSKMNVTFYLARFNQSYSANALLSLCSFPYFIFVMVAAVSKCNLVKDKAFDRIFNDNKSMVNKLLISVLK